MEKLEISYREGDFDMRYPELELEHLDKVLGKYGMMRGQYLKEHKPSGYYEMLMDGTKIEFIVKSCMNEPITVVEGLQDYTI